MKTRLFLSLILFLDLIGGCSLGLTPELAKVDEYNARFNDGRTERWVKGIVYVHDSIGIPNNDLTSILEEINEFDGPQFVEGGSGSEIEIKMVKELSVDNNGNEPLAETEALSNEDGEIYKAEIRVSLNRYWSYDRRVFKHELIHARGFVGHTDDGGLMDAKPKSDIITPTVVSTLQELYRHPPGTEINPLL